MNQVQSNNFKINSQFFIQQLDALIIKITRSLAIEYEISPDPEAKEMVRRMLLNRANQLMSEQSEQFVKEIRQSVESKIKSRSVYEYDKQVYELIKMMGLDNA